MVFVRKPHSGGATQYIDSQTVVARHFCKRVLQRPYIQRGRIKLIGKIDVFLIVNLALDLYLVEVIEIGTNAR